jgi:molybdenum cofactor synthesis domain-containing protein
VRATVITVSDSSFAGRRPDLSGPRVRKVLEEAGFTVDQRLVPDDVEAIASALRDSAIEAQLVVTTGGTGLAERDVTPEATLSVCTRLVPGLAERMRSEGAQKTPLAALSRGVCGILDRTLVINLPGSPAGAQESLETVLPLLPHALELLAGHTDHAGLNR